jgi:hypothetical protein
MARRKASSRIPRLTPPTRRAGAAWDQVFLGNAPQTNRVAPSSYLDVGAIRSQSAAIADPILYQEVEMALNGDDTDLLPYQPTPTINPGRPRTLAAGYDERSQSLRIKFRDGSYYTYYNVPPSVWWKFQRAQSPGRYINSTLNSYPYTRGLM